MKAQNIALALANIKMRILIGILLISTYSFGFSQNPIWVNIDKRMISNFIKSYKKDSTDLMDFFSQPKAYDTTYLGRNYYTVDLAKGGGYISIRAKYLYRNDTLVAYKVNPQMPDEPELIDKYKSWYSRLFEFKDSREIIPIYFNEDKWFEPLLDYKGVLEIENQSDLFKHFFSVESGNIYGYNNGWGGLRYNRALFEKLLPELNTDLIVFIMYSKNPISRLQAFQYYLTNKSEFPNQTEIEGWINEVLKNHPIINCADSDIIGRCNPKEKLMEYVEYELKKK